MAFPNKETQFKKGESGNDNGSGIYRITFTKEWFYIGSSVNLKKRANKHLYDLKAEKHCNNIMANVYRKHGTFNFDVLEYCDIDKLTEKEQYYIDTESPTINILKVANSSVGYKHTAEAIEKMKISTKNNAKIPSVRAKMQMTWFKKGVTIKHSQETIQKRAASLLGYKHSDDAKKNMSNKANQRDYSKIDISNWLGSGAEASKKAVAQYDLTGIKVNEFNSITDAITQFGTKQTRHLVACLHGKKETYNNFIWKFA